MRNRGTTAAGQGGTRSLPDDQMELKETKVGTHKHGKGSTSRKTTPRQIYKKVREFPNKALCESTARILATRPGPAGLDIGPELQVLHWKTRIDPVQGQKMAH